MIGCHSCGARNRDGARFCGTCGTRLGSARAGVRKVVTVLFADASRPVGGEPDLELDVRATKAFYDLVREVLERYGGTVERHAGDAVMSVFGVPVVRDDDARRAAAAALELRDAVGKLGDVAVRIGVNTGEVLTGDATRQEELAVGDPVVVAARLQQSAAPGEILLGPATRVLLGAEAVAGEPRHLVIRGRAGRLTAVPLEGLAPVTPSGPRGPFVGREAEVGLLLAALRRAVDSDIVQLVTVLAEAGTGKSRLVEEVLQQVTGYRVLRGFCRGYGEGSGWSALGDILRSYTGRAGRGGLARLEDRSPDLAAVHSVLASLVGVGDVPVSSAELSWAVASVLTAMAEVEPIVVVFEDLHAASGPLLDLVPSVISQVSAGRVVVVVTARPELLDQRPDWGRDLRHVLGLTLRPLADPEARRLAASLLPDDPDGVEHLLASAGGNPLFLEQLAQARREGAEVSAFESAPTVAAVLSARLDRLPVEARRALERAALIGAEGAVADLRPLCEGVVTNLDQELELLAARDLVELDGAQWTLTSDVLREVTVGGIAREERAELHQVRGLVLGARGSAAAAGFHLEQAASLLRVSDADRAAALGEQAASRLAAAGLRALSGDLDAACDLLARAVALLPLTSPRRLSLLTELARGLQLTGDLARAREVLEEAVSRCDELGLREAGAHARLARLDLRRSTEPEQAYAELPALLAQVLPTLEAAGDDRGLSLAWQLQASALQYRVRWAAMQAPLERALHHGQRAGERRLVEQAQSLMVGSIFHGPMPFADGRQRLEEMLEAPGISTWQQASIAARLAGIVALQGDPDAGLVQVDAVRATFRQLGRELSGLATAFMSGPMHLLAGTPERAVDVLREACTGLQAMGDRAFTSTLAALLAEACWRCDDLDGASAAVGLSRQLSGVGDVISQVRWRSVQAKLEAVRRNHDEAMTLSSRAVQMVVSTDEVTSQGDVLADAAEVQLLLGNRSAGEVLLQDALARYERKGAPQAAKVALARLM